MLLRTNAFKIHMIAGVISNQIVNVEEYCKGLASEKKIRRLIKETGFRKLSIAPDGVCTSDMCFQAAEYILDFTGIDRESIGALLFVSQTPDYIAPSTAYVLQKRLGLSHSLAAFDINLGCSGFVYGLYVASLMLSSMPNKKVFLCCGDVSQFIDPNSPGAHAISGDAGTCTLLEANLDADYSVYFNIDSYGYRFRSLYVPNGGGRNPYTFQDGKIDSNDQNNFSVMDGMDILNFSMNEVSENINELLTKTKNAKNDIGSYLFHQPNYILIQSLQERLGLSNEQVIYNSQNIGNTSSASIPLLLTEMGNEWEEKKNKTVLMSGFGIGLSVASVIIDLQDTICTGTLQYDNKFTFQIS